MTTWTMEYNDLNQLTDRATGTGAAGDERWSYAYDANGNLVAATQETSNGSVWSVSEEWVYQWNPRDQMTRALKYAGGSANNAKYLRKKRFFHKGPGALSKRLEYGAGTGSGVGALVSGSATSTTAWPSCGWTNSTTTTATAWRKSTPGAQPR